MVAWHGSAWLKTVRTALAAAGLAVAPVAATAQDAAQVAAQDIVTSSAAASDVAKSEQVQAARANPPLFSKAWIAYHNGDTAYFDCVEQKKKSALAEMWSRGAPLEAALYEISIAYRNCPGFEAIWSAMYFGGFDSPEHWIALEIQAAKAAVVASAETELPALAKAARRLGAAASAVNRVEKAERDDRVAARDALLRSRYVATALRPDDALAPDIEELVQEYSELLAAILPEKAAEELKSALELSEERSNADDLAEYVIRKRR